MAMRNLLAYNVYGLALLELGALFLPAIPAYLWMWPNNEGATREIAQIVTYVYILAGTLFIGLRRWSLDQLGLNRRGLGLALACSLVILLGRALVVLSIDWQLPPPHYSWTARAGQILYFFGFKVQPEG